jgi:hypothetical protein
VISGGAGGVGLCNLIRAGGSGRWATDATEASTCGRVGGWRLVAVVRSCVTDAEDTRAQDSIYISISELVICILRSY